MILIRPSVEVMGCVYGTDILKSIELYGRTCYKSEEKITEDSSRKFVRSLIKRGHESVIEHEKITVKIICDRGVSHEIVRHRIASYSQESTRYCDYADGQITFVIPPWVAVEPGEYDPFKDDLFSIDISAARRWLLSMAAAEANYQELRKFGWRPEQARAVLPNSLKTEIVVTYNLREWRHFFKLRTSPAAHPQMREVAMPLLDALHFLVPVVFADIYEARISVR